MHSRTRLLVYKKLNCLGMCIGGSIALLPRTVLAHGDQTGVAHLIVDYGLPFFLFSMVIIAIAVGGWILLRPLPLPDDPEGTTERMANQCRAKDQCSSKDVSNEVRPN